MTTLIDQQWQKTTLGEVIELFDHKRIPLSSKEREKRQGSYPYYGASGIIDSVDDYIFDGRYLLIAEDGENLNSRKKPIAFFANGKFWVNNHAHILRGIPNVINDYFLMSYIRTTDISGYITGTAQPKLSQANLKAIELALPPLPTQRKIAGVLSAYDDLIENNTRRIAILEEMAQLLYREWFVHFRFPGHEDVEMVSIEEKDKNGSVSSVNGPIPEGWQIQTLKSTCQLVVGQSPKSKFYNEDGNGLPFHQGVTDFGTLFPETRRYCTETKRIAEAGDILFSVRAPVGRMNLADRKIVIGRGLHAIRSKLDKQLFIFQQLRDRFQEEDTIGSGTIFKSVGKSDMLGIELLVPSYDLLERFEAIAQPIYSEIANLTKRNALLRTTRDLLLPRLISGEVDISELDIATGGDL